MLFCDTYDVLHVEKSSGADTLKVEYTLFLPESLIDFQGHFPGLPLLPGIAQVHWIMEFSKALGATGNFISMERLKFMRPILPQKTIQLVLILSKENTHIEFQFFDNEGRYSEGRIILDGNNV
ncbi:MAG: hypothetical protein K6L81_14585 [Agarilytica sp.]